MIERQAYAAFSCFNAYVGAQHLIPDMEVDSIADIDAGELKKRSIRKLAFGVDNTLCRYYENSVNEAVRDAFMTMQELFAVCLVSNTAPERREEMEKFEVYVVSSKIKKNGACAF